MANKKIVSLQKKRNIALIKKIFRIIRIPVVILAVAAALFLSARLLGNVAVSNITDGIRQVKTLFSKGEGYPYSLEAFDFRKVDAIGNRPLVLCDDSSVVLSSSAGKLFEMQLGVADSKVITKNGRAMIFSNSSNKIILQSKTEKLGEMTAEGTVVAAALAENGSFAVSYAKGEYQSVLSVYNSRFKEVFRWECSQERIADISLSGNGKNLAVIAVGAENAEIYTRLLIFNIGDAEPKADLRYSGTLFLRVAYTSSGKVIAVGDNKTVVLTKKGEPVDETVYSEDSLLSVCIDDSGNTVVFYEEFGGSKTGMVRYSSGGKKTCALSFDGTPDCAAAQGGKTAAAFGSEITVWSSSGNEVKRITAENPVSDIFFGSGNLYTVENGAIYKH